MLQLRHPRKKLSANRKHLLVVTSEGIPAIVIYQLLGGPFLTGYLLYLGGSSQQVGLVMAIPTAVNVLQIAMAFLMQKLKNRHLALVLGGTVHRLLWVATGLIPFVFPCEWWIPVFIAMYSIAFAANAVTTVVWSSLVGDIIPLKIRGRYLGIRNTILWAAGSIMTFVGGLILESVPEGRGFAVLYLICAVCAVLNIFLYGLYPNPPFEKSKLQNGWTMFASPFRDRPFLKTMLFLSLWLFLQGIVVPLFSYVMLDVMKIGYRWVSVFTMVQTLAMMASYYFWGNLNAKYSSRTLLLWVLPMLALSCLLWAGLAVLPMIPVLLFVHIFLGIGTGGYNQIVFNFTISDTPKSERPMYIAVFSALTGFAAFLGPLLGGMLYKTVASMPAWIQIYGLSASIGILLTVLAFAMAPKIFKQS